MSGDRRPDWTEPGGPQEQRAILLRGKISPMRS
jgi:hypothetical protein